ncbi:uncharacterized protein B0P05DRAFT_548225 [Gilbertella persicaria]|uniref:uncharacterized protein n=1 Tax=Gilbertella persicaria TaxID=101096 RepID=UPI00221E742B|nr:uncharacterized protein B0P05DRAFT_548225 [Gilbertella persicaria]KAI8074355.1 hypothetical protein B0P05DRAFT_548225 [Gilbertella persicaria]
MSGPRKTDSFNKTIHRLSVQDGNSASHRNIPQHNKSSSKKPTRIARPSKSETTRIENTSNRRMASVSSQSSIKADQADLLPTKLRVAFADVIETPSSLADDELIASIKSHIDAQAMRIRRLERALEKDQVNDKQNAITFLLSKYPEAMSLYRKQVEQEQYEQQLRLCIDQFEAQKQHMITEYQRNFEILKSKYRSRFDDIVERMISDPSRLDDEWARRVQKDADDRIEEFKRRFLLKQKMNRI